MLGNVVNNLVNANQSSGYKSIQWNDTLTTKAKLCLLMMLLIYEDFMHIIASLIQRK